MKKWYIISGIIGAIFFGISYLAVNINIYFSLVIAIVAFIASYYIFHERNETVVLERDLTNEYQILVYGEECINKIAEFQKLVIKKELIEDIKNLCDVATRIIKYAKEDNKKIKTIKNYVSYYLPLTINILTKYNKIEDERLTSKESKQFMEKVERLIEKIIEASNNQLNSMYSTEMLNTNAEIKVFENMLKTDGLVDDNMNIKIEKEEGEINE